MVKFESRNEVATKENNLQVCPRSKQVNHYRSLCQVAKDKIKKQSGRKAPSQSRNKRGASASRWEGPKANGIKDEMRQRIDANQRNRSIDVYRIRTGGSVMGSGIAVAAETNRAQLERRGSRDV